MGHGLSQQQSDILAVLPWFTYGMDSDEAPTAREIVSLIGLEVTASTRASVSRAVSRLQARGLILPIGGGHRLYRSTGYARATPEQVKSWQDAQVAMRSRYSTAAP